MAVPVVDVLEPVEVSHHERQRAAESLDPRQLRCERFLALTAVGQAGQAVDEGLPLDDPVQAGVVERDDRVRGEGDGGHPVLVIEVVAEEQQRAEVRVTRGQRHLDFVGALVGPARLYELAARGHDHAALRARRLDRSLDDQPHQLVDVVRRAQRFPES